MEEIVNKIFEHCESLRLINILSDKNMKEIYKYSDNDENIIIYYQYVRFFIGKSKFCFQLELLDEIIDTCYIIKTLIQNFKFKYNVEKNFYQNIFCIHINNKDVDNALIMLEQIDKIVMK